MRRGLAAARRSGGSVSGNLSARSLPTSSNQQALARPPSQRALSANELQPTSPGSSAVATRALCQQAPTNKPWLVRRRNARSLPPSSNQQALARPPSQRALSANRLQPTSPGSSAVATRALCQQAPTNKPWLVRRRNARSLPPSSNQQALARPPSQRALSADCSGGTTSPSRGQAHALANPSSL